MGEGEYTVRVTRADAPMGESGLVGADPKRVGIIFAQINHSADVYVRAMGWGGGYSEYPVPSEGVLNFWCKDVGPLVSGAWDIRTSAGSAGFNVTEILKLSYNPPAPPAPAAAAIAPVAPDSSYVPPVAEVMGYALPSKYKTDAP